MIKKVVRFFGALLTLFALYICLTSLISVNNGDCFPLFSLSSLLLPGVLMMSGLLIVFWLFQRSAWAIIPVISILISLGYIGAVFRLPLRSTTPSAHSDDCINLCTYNIQGFSYGQRYLTIGLIAEFVKNQEITILCLQEMEETTFSLADSLLITQALLSYDSIVPGEKPGFGLGIFSRYPILQAKRIPLGIEGNQAMQTDLLIGNDTIRLYNFHLQTTNFNQSKFDLKGENLLWDIEGEAKKTQSLKSRLQSNIRKRNEQTRLLKTCINSSPYPVLLCGDMNANPASYSYHLLKEGLSDGFRTAGKGYEYTYRYLFNLFRIDYIFHSRELTGLSYKSFELDYSDHKPVVMKLTIGVTDSSTSN